MRRLALLAAAACLLCAGGAGAQMYKCTGAGGTTQYSDKPCPDGRGKAVDIRAQPPISGTLAPQGTDAKSGESDFQRRRIERGREEDNAAARAEQQKRRCAEMHSQVDFLTRVNVVSRMNEKGERVYLDDATRDARLAQLNAEIARSCR